MAEKMKPRSYGTVTIRERRDGTQWFTLPAALRRDFALRAGDTVTFSSRKGGGLWLRFYRHRKAPKKKLRTTHELADWAERQLARTQARIASHGAGWWRLLPGPKKRAVKHPR